jgi:hypothetical protein
LLFAGAVLTGRAASFSAELVNTQRGASQTGLFSFQDGGYRYEVAEAGQTTVVIRDAASGVLRLLQPSDKKYLEAGPDEPLSRLADPFGCYAYYARKAEVKPEGTEPIDGLPCIKQVVSSHGQVYVVAWFSEELGFPLKVEIPLFGQIVELRRVQRGPLDAALFAVPAGYTLAPPPEEFSQPAWAGQVPGAPEASAPFERTLEAGNILRVRPRQGQHLRLEVTNTRAEPCTFTAVSFKGGRALSDPSFETSTLEKDQEMTMTMTKGPSEADDLVLRTSAGAAKIKAAWLAAGSAGAPGGPAAPAAYEGGADVAAPATVDMGARFEVVWTGPGANEDYITVARPNQPPGASVSMTRIREGNPVKIWAPSDPGDYEVRYIQARGSKVLASVSLTVNPVGAAVRTADAAKVADWIEVTWEGPAGEGDFVSVARPEQAPGASLSLVRVKEGNPVRLRAPSDPGAHEVRYILARGNKLLARSPITIEPVVASVEATARAAVGTDVEVRWTGPGYPEDFIAIARSTQPTTANLGARPTRLGNPVKMKLPKEPGVYELRYILGRGNRLLGKTTITVVAP